jgi:hypothetical protein
LKEILIYPHEAESTTFQTHYFSEILVGWRIEAGTYGSVTRNSDLNSNVQFLRRAIEMSAIYSERLAAP